MGYRILGILLFSLFSTSVFSQNIERDSLRNVFNNESLADSIRFEAGNQLIMMNFGKNIDSARYEGEKVLELAKAKNNLQWQTIVNRLIGNTYAIQGSYEDALMFFTKSVELATQSNDKTGISVGLNNVGLIYYEQGNFPIALDFFLKSLKLSEELNDKKNISRVTNNLGNVYLRQGDNEKALEYYQFSLNIKNEIGTKNEILNSYNNIGLVYTNLNQPEKALENLVKSAELSEEVGNPMALSRAYSNIGEAYTSMKEYEKGHEYFNKSLKIKETITDKDGLAGTYVNIGHTYLLQKKYKEAIENCEKSRELSREIGIILNEEMACQCLSNAWEGLGNYPKSLEYYKQYIKLRDSAFNKEKAQEITRQEMQYAFEKQQLADSIAFHKQKADQELLFEKNMNRQRNKFNIIVFGGLALLIIGGVYWRSRGKSVRLAREIEMNTRLKHIDQLKDQFLANTSHELRTPLNGIIGITESLKDGIAGPLPEKANENLEMIANSGRRLSHLINDILDFSKLKNKDLVLALSPVDLYQIVNLVLKFSEPLLDGKKIKLINKVPPDLPLLEADENRLQQILYNLIGNAIKFTKEGEIEIAAKIEDHLVAVSVQDTGIGIAPEHQSKIFGLFEQADSSTEREYGGTGLGLTVTKQLVELHGGAVSLTSTPGKGSCFTFTIPLSQIERSIIAASKGVKENGVLSKIQEDILKSESLSPMIPEKAQNMAHILIVDDEPINRRVLQNHLTIAGYQVTEVNNGFEALDLLADNLRFDLVLLDIMMPGMSGYEVCQKIREKYLPSELPVVLLTAKNRVSDLVTGFHAGANDYLTKPFSKNELLSRLKTHLNLKGIHKATNKFVPVEFLRSVGREAVTEVVLGDHIQKEVTVLFSDIRGYTSLAETMTPRQNFKFVNAYVGRMGPVIKKNQGFVNQYLGDGIMALFPNDAASGLNAAIEMQQAISTYNTRRISEGFAPISVGIGIHTGPLIMGIIGDSYRNDTAIIADTVNTASRVEGVTKYFGARIIISEDSLKTMPDPASYNLRYLGKVQAKGKDLALGIYECFDGDDPENIELKIKTLGDFQKGLNHFLKKEFPRASGAFDKVLSKNPNDSVARYFVTRSAEYTISGVPDDLEIVNIMDQK